MALFSREWHFYDHLNCFLMKRLLIACFVLVGISAFSYPTSPAPLRTLVTESDYILVGYVMDIRDVLETNEQRPDSTTGKLSLQEYFQKGYSVDYSIARILVREMLQGEIQESIIELSFEPFMVRPAPDQFKVGTEVLLFLKKNDSGEYYTHTPSYGAKTLELPQIEVYKKRIREMQRIMTHPEGLDKYMETVEWLVRCAENEATRWEGVYELSPESDFMSYYARSPFEFFRFLLSPEQKERLRTALLNSTETEYNNLGLIDLVYVGTEKDDVYQYMFRSLKNLPENSYWYADEFMQRMLYAKYSPELETLTKSYREAKYEHDVSRRRLKSILNDFIARAGGK